MSKKKLKYHKRIPQKILKPAFALNWKNKKNWKMMIKKSKKMFCPLPLQDLEDFQVEWHDPISIPYKEYKIYCPPPPCSGFQYLEMLEENNMNIPSFLVFPIKLSAFAPRELL